ncbi:MAG: carbohydrate ABC transporter permease [Anaerolineae bacterium]|nr:carbohydrate ABC transporter permease [Anaerolineae bacterium]
MTLLLISFLAPTFWMISSSLKVSTEIFAHPIVWIPKDPQWSNYERVFQIQPMARFILNTLVVTFWAVLGTVISSVLVAYAFSRLRWPGRDFWFALLLATMMLPEIITLIPRFIMFKNFGWINTFLPLTVPYWFAATPLYVFLIRQFFSGIPFELEEAARIDGANRLQVLMRVLLPLSGPVLATVAIFAVLQHYNDFMNPLIFINSRDNWTLALGMTTFNDPNDPKWELAFAAGTVMVTPILILFLVAQRYFVQGIALTGFGGR